MGRHCGSCGGLLGRDCFNERECRQITEDMVHRAMQGDARPRPLSPEERCLAAMPAEVARHPEGSDVWAKMMLETANRAIALVESWRKEGRLK